MMKAKLLVINSNLEQTYIVQNMDSSSWIGLHDTAVEGTWRWVDGTHYDLNVKFWGETQPDQQRDEDCALMHPDGTWHDWPCSSTHFFICEKPEE
ncbi:asialoglycoprotein receptor 2-like [Leucoraja erinacea]|uniref:asialoglycoprotein receptor 2-like n=1 Tax=Leucoraja erinaceus TaxID=7782 RepID=UPI002456A610|nr:asialoglycoprotein receptor 2-like [Leucoraja erinacea]